MTTSVCILHSGVTDVTHMAVDIPELDQPGNQGLLRLKWFPLAMTEPSTFLTILLLAASNYATMKEATIPRVQLLQLKDDALRFINAAIVSDDKKTCDAIIGAVAKMASFEAMYGSPGLYHFHMRGLKTMVAMRGGLLSLGLDNLLRRIIIWIDLNSSFLLGTPRYFSGGFSSNLELSDPEVNPGQYIAI